MAVAIDNASCLESFSSSRYFEADFKLGLRTSTGYGDEAYNLVQSAFPVLEAIKGVTKRLRAIKGTLPLVLLDQCEEVVSRLDTVPLMYRRQFGKTAKEIRKIQTLQGACLHICQAFERTLRDFEKQHVQGPSDHLSRILHTDPYGRRINTKRSESLLQEALVNFRDTLSKHSELIFQMEA